MNWLADSLWGPLERGGFLALMAEPFGNAPPPQQLDPSDVPRFVSLLGNGEFMLSLVILVFGAFVILMQFMLLKKARPAPAPADIMRVFSITAIIVGVCLAMTAGYRTEQVAPVLGIFGTIAGYLLGYMSRPGPQTERGLGEPSTGDEPSVVHEADKPTIAEARQE